LNSLKSELQRLALKEGFESIGVCRPDSIPHANKNLISYLSNGYHGTMDWMVKRANWRGNPEKLWPAAKSIIVLADSYAQPVDSLENLAEKDCGTIAIYAQNKDYHSLIKKRLKRIGRWLIQKHPNSEIKVFVDTAPVMEKPLGQAAGIGWQGKHTNLISRKLGNWFFLGVIFTTIEIEPDRAQNDHCGSCRKCLDICPTGAFPAPYQMDARKCISYFTIEHKGPIPKQFRKQLGNRIFGCDDCLQICPWNKFAQQSTEIRYQARAELKSPKLNDLASLSEAQFKDLFRGGPVIRIGYHRFIRNVLYAIGNSDNPQLLKSVVIHKNSQNEAVSEAAHWAENELLANG